MHLQLELPCTVKGLPLLPRARWLGKTSRRMKLQGNSLKCLTSSPAPKGKAISKYNANQKASLWGVIYSFTLGRSLVELTGVHRKLRWTQGRRHNLHMAPGIGFLIWGLDLLTE